jgi:hypothetical protein
MSAEALENVAQIGKRIDVELLAGGDEAGQHGRRPPAVVASEEEPVLASDRDPTQAALGAGMPTSGLCRAISPPMGSERESAALIVTEAA